MTALSSSFITVQCSSGSFVSFSTLTMPATVSDVVVSDYTLLAPLYQLNFQKSDVPPVVTTSGSPTTAVQTSTRPGSTATFPSSTATIPASTITESSQPTGGPSTSPPSGGLSNTAKIGIGVGAGIGAALLLVIALLLWRLRRRDRSQSAGEKTSGLPFRSDSKKKGALPVEPELAGAEVKELDGKPIQSELPTTMPSHKVPPGDGTRFRLSDQNWTIPPGDGTDGLALPLEAHPGAVFELEGDSTPRSGTSTAGEDTPR